MDPIVKLQRDPAAFRSALLIDTDQGSVPFSEVMDDWQKNDFAALDNGWRRAAGQKPKGDCYSRAWLERPRGHSKSSDVMIMATWALFAARKPLKGVIVAVDRDQASINRDHVARLISMNPWLSKVLDCQQLKVVNKHTGSSMEIMASDVASSYGLLIDFAVCDEVTLWPKRDLFDSILSASAKRASCLLLCIGNAGFMDSWQAEIRTTIRADADWFFSRLDGPQASWIDPKRLAEQERLLPPAAYERLWLNIWSAGAGDAIPAADIAAAFKPDLKPMAGPEKGWDFVAGVDLGVSRDASAVVILAVRRGKQAHGRIRLAHLQLWKPSKGKRVDLQQVEDTLRLLHDRFDFKQISYDPWQATHLASRLQAVGLGRLVKGSKRPVGLPMVEVPQQGATLQKIATVVREAFSDRRLDLYKDPDLERDIRRLRIVERSYGFRLESPRDSTGHGDSGSAFQYAMLAASELASKQKIVIRVGLDSYPDDDPLEAVRQRTEDWDRRQAEYDRERHWLAEPEDPMAGFGEAFKEKFSH